MTKAKGRKQAKQQGAKLRKGSNYFVANPDDVRSGKRIPLTCHYRGRHPEGHLFTDDKGSGGGYWLSDREITTLVEPWSKEKEAEVVAEATYYNEHGKLMPAPRAKQVAVRQKNGARASARKRGTLSLNRVGDIVEGFESKVAGLAARIEAVEDKTLKAFMPFVERFGARAVLEALWKQNAYGTDVYTYATSDRVREFVESAEVELAMR